MEGLLSTGPTRIIIERSSKIKRKKKKNSCRNKSDCISLLYIFLKYVYFPRYSSLLAIPKSLGNPSSDLHWFEWSSNLIQMKQSQWDTNWTSFKLSILPYKLSLCPCKVYILPIYTIHKGFPGVHHIFVNQDLRLIPSPVVIIFSWIQI